MKASNLTIAWTENGIYVFPDEHLERHIVANLAMDYTPSSNVSTYPLSYDSYMFMYYDPDEYTGGGVLRVEYVYIPIKDIISIISADEEADEFNVLLTDIVDYIIKYLGWRKA